MLWNWKCKPCIIMRLGNLFLYPMGSTLLVANGYITLMVLLISFKLDWLLRATLKPLVLTTMRHFLFCTSKISYVYVLVSLGANLI
jgi:hypothetical protein